MFLKTKEEVKNWLDCYGIKNYIINDDLTVDVDNNVNNVNLHNRNITSIPVKFNIVTGNFDCSYNILTSLEFAPKIVGGVFDCYKNPLTSLQGATKDKLKEIITYYPHLIHTLSTEELLDIV